MSSKRRPSRPEGAQSYVYFIQAGSSHGPVKIGVTFDPLARLRQLQTSHYEQLVLVSFGPGTEEQEQEVHRLLRKYRVRGEWFLPCKMLWACAVAAMAKSEMPKDYFPVYAQKTDRHVRHWAHLAFARAHGARPSTEQTIAVKRVTQAALAALERGDRESAFRAAAALGDVLDMEARRERLRLHDDSVGPIEEIAGVADGW